ncbi:BC1881 family protein [Brevibacillus centrosporus]|uniref:BC1881 family protein n=1 Tax=Brevibacillus centrosporus TaxID=54910 RepID=UPI003B02970F
MIPQETSPILTDISTKDLTDELMRREGISTVSLEPYAVMKITAGSNEREIQGPAIILINQD